MSYLDKLKEEFLAISQSDETDHFFEGFSERLHFFLDQVEDIDIPKRINRPTFLTKITECSRGAARQWLQLDQTPRGRFLLYLIIFFLRHIPSAKDLSPIEVETWLKYGDTIIPNPFQNLEDIHFQLAKLEVEKTAKKINLSLAEFNSTKAADDVSKILRCKKVSTQSEVTQTIRSQIIFLIGKHTFDQTTCGQI